VLKRHNAALRIDSVVGKGSTFVCDFPPDIIVHKREIYDRRRATLGS